MSQLSLQQCNNLSTEDTVVLKQEETDVLSLQLDPQWQLDTDEQTISHTFSFNDYCQTIASVNVIAQIAHQQEHHPDLLVSYNRCTVTYSTHSVSGLSIKDFICAAKINAAQDL